MDSIQFQLILLNNYSFHAHIKNVYLMSSYYKRKDLKSSVIKNKFCISESRLPPRIQTLNTSQAETPFLINAGFIVSDNNATHSDNQYLVYLCDSEAGSPEPQGANVIRTVLQVVL